METAPLINYLKKSDIDTLPPVRPIRNALTQVGVRAKVSALFSSENQIQNPTETISNPDGIKVIRVITGLSEDEQLMKLLEENDMVVIHESSLPNRKIIKKLQKKWYKVTLIARTWNETGNYVIEHTEDSRVIN